MKPLIQIKRIETQRIDEVYAISGMSHNVPGHKEREKALYERIQRDYFDKGLNHAGRPKKA